MAWEVDQERAELKQGKRLQFIITLITLRDLFFVHFVLLGYHITKRISIFVALIYELTCANLSLFGNLNKKKRWKTGEKKWFFGSWTILCLLIVSHQKHLHPYKQTWISCTLYIHETKFWKFKVINFQKFSTYLFCLLWWYSPSYNLSLGNNLPLPD